LERVMSEASPGRHLGTRLRELRTAWGVTQKQLSDALDISGALISSWESGGAVPPEERLNAYARFFATRRSVDSRPPRLIASEDLTAEEEQGRSTLIDELVRLREEALDGPVARPRDTGALGGRFWYFPDGQPITILCTPLTRRQLGWSEEAAEAGDLPLAIQYATNHSHPNAVRNLANGDVDALLELVGHIRAENPTATVRWFMYDRVTNPVEQLTGHVVMLGGIEKNLSTPVGATDVIGAFVKSMNLPVGAEWESEDPEFGGRFDVSLDSEGHPTADPEKIARTEVYRPRFVRDEADPQRPRLLVQQAPQITSDVALAARVPNPVNPSVTLTAMGGIFSRGTYGAVRALTDAQFRTRNEQWLHSAVDSKNFWLLFQVQVFADTTMTPDLTLPRTRLRSSV
jgi:transcriptional regulator with XRE-family HTH domain